MENTNNDAGRFPRSGAGGDPPGDPPEDLLDAVREAVREEMAAARRREAAPAPLLTEQDVADVLDVSTRTVQTLRAAGEIQALRVRGCVRYTPEAVESYLRRAAREGGRR